MIAKDIKIKVNKFYETAILNVTDNSITISYGNREISRQGNYPFIVLMEIRKELEKENVFLLVNGSRIDVYPSGLSMTGFNAYIQTFGKPASLDELINIFDAVTQLDLIGTVEQQIEYHKNWIRSL